MVQEWCTLVTSDSGWIIDNYLGYIMVMKWCYYPDCMLQSMKGLDEPYVEPIISINRWYVKICKNW